MQDFHICRKQSNWYQYFLIRKFAFTDPLVRYRWRCFVKETSKIFAVLGPGKRIKQLQQKGEGKKQTKQVWGNDV